MLNSMLMIITFLMLILLQNMFNEKTQTCFRLLILSGQGMGRLLHLSEIDALLLKLFCQLLVLADIRNSLLANPLVLRLQFTA